MCDVLESLPDHKQNAFKKLMDLMGVNVPGHQPSPKRKYAETSPVSTAFILHFIMGVVSQLLPF